MSDVIILVIAANVGALLLWMGLQWFVSRLSLRIRITRDEP